MLKKYLKLVEFYKYDSYIELLRLSGIIKDKKGIEERFNKENYGLQTISIPIILFSIIFMNISITILTIFVYFCFLFLKTFFTKKAYFDKKIKKIFYKKLKKKMKLTKEFKNFINEYFEDIEYLNFSKKEELKFLLNWEENEKILSKKRIKETKRKLKEKK